MSIEAFEKTNWGWQLMMFQKQVGEWVEYQFSRLQGKLPGLPTGWSISPWVVELLKILFWVVLCLCLAGIGWRLWQQYSPYLYSWWQGLSKSDPTAKPSVDQLSISLLLNQAQDYSRRRNYREACRCLYLAMLQQLHEQAIALQQPSRTGREYLQLLSLSTNAIQPYETLITTHEQLCFSDIEILSENYQQCHQAYREIFPG